MGLQSPAGLRHCGGIRTLTRFAAAQYAWFFGGDGLVATNALISAGEYQRAREELELGEPIHREAIGPTQLIPQKVFSAAQNRSLLNRLTASDFETDWGMREVAASSKDYNPYSYGAGSVSPLSTLTAAVSLWQAHRPKNAFAMWRSVLRWNSLDAMGHMHEVLAGNFYHEQTESVPEQTWSSAALLDATVKGLLGLRLDAAENRVEMAPHLPADWTEVTVENVRLNQATLSFTMRQSATSIDLEIQNSGGPTAVLFRPQLLLGSKLSRTEFAGRAVPGTAEVIDGDEQANVALSVPHEESRCHMQLRGGVAIALHHGNLKVGETSTTPKIVNIGLTGRRLWIEADIMTDEDAVFICRTPWEPLPQPGLRFRNLSNDEYEVRFTHANTGTQTSGATRKYVRTRLRMDLKAK